MAEGSRGGCFSHCNGGAGVVEGGVGQFQRQGRSTAEGQQRRDREGVGQVERI